MYNPVKINPIGPAKTITKAEINLHNLSLVDQVKAHPEFGQKQSYDWYMKNVTNPAYGISSQKFLSDNQEIQNARIVPGQLISYFYSAKYKDELPYWDTFPIVLPFAADATHFTGLNLHYLDYRPRLYLLNELMKYASDDRLNARAKMNVSWKLLKQASKFPGAEQCVKQYIFGNVKSRFLIIPPKMWRFTVNLPLQRFRINSQIKGAGNAPTW